MLSTWLHTPTPFSSPFSFWSSSSEHHHHHRFSMASSVRIAVVGDVHGDWHLEEDTKALELLQAEDVVQKQANARNSLAVRGFLGHLKLITRLGALHRHVIFLPCSSYKAFFTLHFLLPIQIGDLANENVELVRSISSLKFPKAIILGNHDCWYTQQFSNKVKDPVQLQLECLGEEHVGYRRLDFPSLKLSVVGGRPFSCGGEGLFRKWLLSARYGVHNMDASANRIYGAASGTPEEHSIIFLAHNGPTGLGSEMSDICGRDWVYGGGDHGDPDLAQAIARLKEDDKFAIALVVFGHMHKGLAYGGVRKMIVIGADQIIYLNGAIVPRVRRLTDVQESSDGSSWNNKGPLSALDCEGTLRAFTVVEVLDGQVSKIAETWISVVGEKTKIEEEHILLRNDSMREV
ncbi:Calcineurin-like phosphoesterase domain, ApaH type [Dillenia turbinata]|uniref:Calcineurin-like phosphoesterase domain, ApaH type n=1 Tax=Dillenia turbinata TaxID=194707 RepID=A0AAN8ZNL5_9MAGN